MTWRAANSLLVLEHQLQAGAPRAAPPATPAEAWGTIGDSLHDPGSDHSPKDFPGLGNDVVTALDIPHAPALGLDSREVCDDIRRSRDRRIKYMISQDQICSSYSTGTRAAWTWGPYNPNDPNRDRHDTHAHISVVGDARADDRSAWATIGAPAAGEDEDDMGQSFGPALMRSEDMRYPMVIPPVRGGLADPRPTWINAAFDLGSSPVFLRFWAGPGDGSMRPLLGGGHEVVRLESCHVFSMELDAGVRVLSVLRVPDPDGPKDADGKPTGPISDAPVSFCFERQ